MLFFVKTECPADKVDELTRKVVRHEIPPIRGNQVYLSTDGRCGYDLVEARNESECRKLYERYGNDLRILELTEIVPAHQFIERWLSRHPEVERPPTPEQFQAPPTGQEWEME